MKRVAGDCRSVFRGLVRSLSLRRQRPGSIRQAEPRVLALVPEGPNRLILQAISEDTGWTLVFSDIEAEGAASKQSAVTPIIIVDRELAPERWREIVRTLARINPRPYIILLSSNADTNLWDELQRVGGSDILRTPLRRDHLVGALTKAWQLWCTQQHVRPPAAAFKK